MASLIDKINYKDYTKDDREKLINYTNNNNNNYNKNIDEKPSGILYLFFILIFLRYIIFLIIIIF